ncbi:MAG: DUF3343 domain-containing protein [Lachnospiraceae bacterium]
MRKREEKLVVTFKNTTEAMHMESCCKKQGVPGRVIPVPTQISAGCGLAWSCKKEDAQIVQEYIEMNKIKYEQMQFCMLI